MVKTLFLIAVCLFLVTNLNAQVSTEYNKFKDSTSIFTESLPIDPEDNIVNLSIVVGYNYDGNGSANIKPNDKILIGLYFRVTRSLLSSSKITGLSEFIFLLDDNERIKMKTNKIKMTPLSDNILYEFNYFGEITADQLSRLAKADKIEYRWDNSFQNTVRGKTQKELTNLYIALSQ